jgi:hypothetical protein
MFHGIFGTGFGQLQCTTVSIIQWVDAVFALGAAFFWFWASLGKLPAPLIAYANTINDLIPALTRQGRLSAKGAICAALAALIQAFLIIQPPCFG